MKCYLWYHCHLIPKSLLFDWNFIFFPFSAKMHLNKQLNLNFLIKRRAWYKAKFFDFLRMSKFRVFRAQLKEKELKKTFNFSHTLLLGGQKSRAHEKRPPSTNYSSTCTQYVNRRTFSSETFMLLFLPKCWNISNWDITRKVDNYDIKAVNEMSYCLPFSVHCAACIL